MQRTARFFQATSVALVFGAVALAAQGRPANATAECKDGTYSEAAKKSGACSGHGGVKTWFADDKADAKSAKDDAKAAGKATKDAAEKAGHATAKGATAAAGATKDAAGATA